MGGQTGQRAQASTGSLYVGRHNPLKKIIVISFTVTMCINILYRYYLNMHQQISNFTGQTNNIKHQISKIKDRNGIMEEDAIIERWY